MADPRHIYGTAHGSTASAPWTETGHGESSLRSCLTVCVADALSCLLHCHSPQLGSYWNSDFSQMLWLYAQGEAGVFFSFKKLGGEA